MAKVRWLIFLLCCLGIAGNAAEVDSLRVLHFDVDNGFPSNNVYSLIQDRMGYLWFATDNGIVKYNGYSFRIFNSSSGLPSNDVYQFYEDKRGRIWLNSISYELGYMKDDKYYQSNLKTHDRIFKGFYLVDNGEYMFLLYPENSVFYLAVIRDDLESVTKIADVIENDAIGDNTVKHVHIGKTGKLYFETHRYGLYSYDLLHPGRPYRKICTAQAPYTSAFIGGGKVLDKKDDFLLYREKAKEIFFYNIHNCTNRVVKFSFAPAEYIYTVQMADASHDRNGYSYVITNYFLYTVDSVLNIVRKDSINAVTKSSSQLAYRFNDKNGNEWYTTNSAGVWCKMSRPAVFTPSAALMDLRDAAYVGKSKDGSTFWWQKDKAVFYKMSPGGLVKIVTLPFKTGVTSVADESDSLMYLALKAGIYEYNKYNDKVSDLTRKFKSARVTYQLSQSHLVNNDTAKAIFFGGHFQVLAYDSSRFYTVGVNGLHIFDRSSDTLQCHLVTDERLTNVLLDSSEKKVIAYNGQKIVVFDPVSEKYVTLTHEYLKAVLGIDNIVSIKIDKYYNIFIQDNGRLLVYNPFSNPLKEMGFAFNMQGARFDIFDNELIIAGRFGLAKTAIKGILSFGRTNVVPNKFYYSRVSSLAVNTQGDILFSTDKGFYQVNHTNADNFYTVADGSRDFFDIIIKTPHERRISGGDTIVIGQHVDKIMLDAINYYGKGKLIFNYIVGDHTHEWQQTDGDLFTGSLSPGKYYRVVCTVSDDVWKSKYVSFYIYRAPYWWQTTKWRVCFWVVGILAAILLLVGVVLVTRTMVAKGNEKRRTLTELELKAIYAQINPHFIFNTLNAAQYFINKKRFDDAYIHVSKFSRLLRSYLKSSQDRYVVLDEEIQMLKNYIELQQTRFEEKFEYALEVENKIPVHNIKIPSLLLQPLVENAINHGLFHRESGGLLVLKFLQGADNQELVCIIEDNGIGRERSGALNKNIVDRKESYGTKLTQQLIQIYREYEHMHIFMEYNDKTTPETGTIVKLTIKNVKFIG